MKGPARAFALLAAALTLLPPAPSRPSPAPTRFAVTPPTPLTGVFGLNGVGFFHYRDAPEAHETAQQKMDAMQRAGATWDRFDFWWGEMEPRRGVWKWDKADWLIDFYARHHVHMLPILSYSAAWMKAPPHTPQDDAEFADYVAHVVARYKDRVHCWEVWNEPNIPTFWPKPNAADYTAMLKAAYVAAHRADPHCIIVGAAANETDLNWLRDIARDGGMPYMDAVSIHPYSMSDGPEEMDLARQLEDVQTVLAQSGRPTLPVWITEMGWTGAKDDAAGMDRVSAYLAQSYVIAASEGVAHLFWFQLQDWMEGGKLQGWGLLAPDGEPKKTLAAYRHLADTLGGATLRGWLAYPAGTGYVSRRHGRDTVVAWAHRGQTLTMPVGPAARVTDVYGTAVPVRDGIVTVTDSPVTVEGAARSLLAGLTHRRPVFNAGNLVVNGSLAEGDARGAYGWHRGVFYGGADKGEFGADRSDPTHPALRLAHADDALWESFPVPALPGERYTLTAQVKTEGATGENGVQILFLSGPGWGWKGGPTSATVTGTRDWRTVTVTGAVPDDADVVRVNLVSKGNTGTVWFRDIRLTRG